MCNRHHGARHSCGPFHEQGLGHHYRHHYRHHYHHQHPQLISGLLFGLAATAWKTLEHHQQQQQSAPPALQQYYSHTPHTVQTTQEQGITNAHPNQTAAREPELDAPPAYDDAVGTEWGQTPLQNEKGGNVPTTGVRGGWLAPADVESLSREFGEIRLESRQSSSPGPAATGDRGTEPTGRRRGCGYSVELPPRWAEKLRRKEEKVVAKLEHKAEKYARKMQKAAEKAERKGY
jgi:hypothetical protein